MQFKNKNAIPSLRLRFVIMDLVEKSSDPNLNIRDLRASILSTHSLLLVIEHTVYCLIHCLLTKSFGDEVFGAFFAFEICLTVLPWLAPVLKSWAH